MKKQLTFILIALFLCSSAASAQIRRTDFMNHSYSSSLCTENFQVPNPVRVRRGKFAEGEAWFDIQAKAHYADINGDGSEDALVHAKCGSTAGNFNNSDVFVYGMQGRRAKLLASIDTTGIERGFKRYFKTGFIVTVKGVKAQSGRIVIEAYTDGSNASPKYISTLTYRLTGSKLVLTGRPVRRLNS